MSGDGVQLAWVMLDGQPCHVSTFAGVPPSHRPEVTCPACGEPVVLRLGARLAHHAAHRAGQECAATAPESALHLNCKLHIAAQLRGFGGSGVQVDQDCAMGAAGCTGLVTRPWMLGWDEVAVELRVASRRPDVVLLRHDVPLGAIEVCVHSAVSDPRRRALAALGLSWIEVAGSPDVLRWRAGEPLRVQQSAPDPRLRCPPCARRDRAIHLAPEDDGRWRGTLRRYSAHTIRARAFAQSTDGAAARSPAVEELLLYDRYSPHRPGRRRGALVTIRHEDALILWDTLDARCISRLQPASPHATLRRDADRHLRALQRLWIVDVGGSWWSPALALGHPEAAATWADEGIGHRWPGGVAGLPPRGPEATLLDLTAWLLATRLDDLPARWGWGPLGWRRVTERSWRHSPTVLRAAAQGVSA
jgi:hypothetical protein